MLPLEQPSFAHFLTAYTLHDPDTGAVLNPQDPNYSVHVSHWDYSGFTIDPVSGDIVRTGGGHSATPSGYVSRCLASTQYSKWFRDYAPVPLATMKEVEQVPAPIAGETWTDAAGKHWRSPNLEPFTKLWNAPGYRKSCLSIHAYDLFRHSSLLDKFVYFRDQGQAYAVDLGIAYKCTLNGTFSTYDRDGVWQGVPKVDTGSGGCCELPNGFFAFFNTKWTVVDPRTMTRVYTVTPKAAHWTGGVQGVGLGSYGALTRDPEYGDLISVSNAGIALAVAFDPVTYVPRLTQLNRTPPTGIKVKSTAYDTRNGHLFCGVTNSTAYALKRTGPDSAEWLSKPTPSILTGTTWGMEYIAPLNVCLFTAKGPGGNGLWAVRWDSPDTTPPETLLAADVNGTTATLTFSGSDA